MAGDDHAILYKKLFFRYRALLGPNKLLPFTLESFKLRTRAPEILFIYPLLRNHLRVNSDGRGAEESMQNKYHGYPSHGRAPP